MGSLCCRPVLRSGLASSGAGAPIGTLTSRRSSDPLCGAGGARIHDPGMMSDHALSAVLTSFDARQPEASDVEYSGLMAHRTGSSGRGWRYWPHPAGTRRSTRPSPPRPELATSGRRSRCSAVFDFGPRSEHGTAGEGRALWAGSVHGPACGFAFTGAAPTALGKGRSDIGTGSYVARTLPSVTSR